METTVRVADLDRERVAERLRRAHAEGRIDLFEFDERLAAAYAARTEADLRPLTADLPAGVSPAVADRPIGKRATGHLLALRIEVAAWLFAGC